MNMKELIRTAVIALIFFGIGAATAESNLYTFTLRADRVLTDYIGGNATASEVNITGLIIQGGQVTEYYNESVTDGLLGAKANLSHNHSLEVSNVSGLQGTLTDKSNTTHQHNISDSNITAGINASKIGNGTVDNAEFEHLNGVTSAIQTQINNKFDSSNHTKQTHDALGIDADTVDGSHANAFATASHAHPPGSEGVNYSTTSVSSGTCGDITISQTGGIIMILGRVTTEALTGATATATFKGPSGDITVYGTSTETKYNSNGYYIASTGQVASTSIGASAAYQHNVATRSFVVVHKPITTGTYNVQLTWGGGATSGSLSCASVYNK